MGLEIETSLDDARRVVKQAIVSIKLDLRNEDWNGDGNAGEISCRWFLKSCAQMRTNKEETRERKEGLGNLEISQLEARKRALRVRDRK